MEEIKGSSVVDTETVIEFAMDAGEILLENGAEIFRVSETMERISKHFGVESASFFTLSNGILASGGNVREPLFSKVKHIPVQGVRLDMICAVNQMSREIAEGKYTLEQAQEVLKRIRSMPGKKIRTQIIAGAISTGAFSYMFGGTWTDSAAAVIAGLLIQPILIFICGKYLSRLMNNLCGGVFITIVSILLCEIGIGHNLSNMIISQVMLLIPGIAFINGIRDLANADYLSGAVRLLDAILRFVCIAVGVGAVIMVCHRFFGGMIV